MVQPNAPVKIYQPHILPLHITPPIWRRLHVPSDSSIAMLHDLLQIAFDWSDFHLHRFVIRGKEYGVSRMGCTTFTTDARKELLSQFGFRINERFLYEYDFGDLWQHQIRFEGGVAPVFPGLQFPGNASLGPSSIAQTVYRGLKAHFEDVRHAPSVLHPSRLEEPFSVP